VEDSCDDNEEPEGSELNSQTNHDQVLPEIVCGESIACLYSPACELRQEGQGVSTNKGLSQPFDWNDRMMFGE